MIPALLSSTSIRGSPAASAAASRTLARSPWSSGTKRKSAPGAALAMRAIARCALASSRQASSTRAPFAGEHLRRLESDSGIGPVTTTVRPVWSARRRR
jgi:hypothetical protein